jgi:multicomponent Na+:H+ antiporter subunit G
MIVVTSILVLGGTFFALVAALGLLRLPDLPMRMHAATKAGTLGAGLLLVAVAMVSPGPGAIARALAGMVFLFLTAPVAAHLVARAAYRAGEMPLWHRTAVDELGDSAGGASAVSATQRERDDTVPVTSSPGRERGLGTATPRTGAG